MPSQGKISVKKKQFYKGYISDQFMIYVLVGCTSAVLFCT